ncbi:MAG TPA: GntR family transcriptional regulator [Stellaceae bacterium]|jgi:GntR family transcriptional regulator|nr:GntR family transcriptional regulator [Stellaceae bacterium]
MSELAKTLRLSVVPLYIQVAAELRRRIESGHWASGQKISTIEDLQAEFGVARVTVRQAVELLEKDKLVRRQQGRGTFVAADLEDTRWLKLDTSWSSLIGTLKHNVPKFMPVSAPMPAPRLGTDEGRAAPEYVFLRSVQYRGERAYSVVNVQLAKDIYERDPQAFRRHAALPIVAGMKGVKIATARQTLVIGSAEPEIAGLLGVPLNAPTAEARCVVVDRRGIAIYVADITYRGDCIRLETTLLNDCGSTRPAES